MRIWKYPLNIIDSQTLRMPEGAKVLSVQFQYGGPQLWALVDEHAPKVDRQILTIGTGNPMPDGVGRFIDTYQLAGGDLVFHVFEVSSDEVRT